MDRVHSDEEVIRAASKQDIGRETKMDNKTDVAVDLKDNHGVVHTYVVTFKREAGRWVALQVNELSSL